jgi:type I restriction enzyme S subunit
VSRIDELITELAPDGVRHVALSKVACYSPTRVDASELDETSFVGVDNLVSNKGGRVDASYLPNTVRLTAYEPGDILLGNIRPYLRKVWLATNTGGCSGDVLAIRINEAAQQPLAAEFLYYLLSSDEFFSYNMQHAKGAKMPRGNKTAILNYRIPVPPLDVQREIVTILDQFTQLEAELEAELEARRRQHAFYWESLLSPREGWRTTTIGEVAQVFDGPHATPKKTQTGPWYLSISSLKNGRFDLTESAHLGDDEFPKWTRRVAPRLGDTMFSYETRLGEAAFWDRDEPAALGRRMGLLRPRESFINPRFLTLVYLGPEIQAVIKAKTVSGSTVNRIPIANMASWQLAIPPIEEQKRIVDALDKFDALVNDLSVGLPAELAARRKQYEYYRNELLTFEEAAV